MIGKIRTKEKCPKCKGKFINNGQALICSTCLTSPTRYFIDVFWHKRYKIYSDKDGRVLSSYELAQRVLTEIRQGVDHRTFDPCNYVAVKLKALQFTNNITAWLKRQETRKESDELSPSYYVKVKGIVKKYLIPYFKNMDVREIRTSHVEDFNLNLPKKLSLKSKKNILDLLRKYFNDLYDRDEIKTKPKFPRIKLNEPHWNWVGEDAQDLIYNQIAEVHRPIFMFIKETGCRPGESRAVWKEDIDLKEGTVTIRRNFSNEQLRMVTKTKRQRILPLQEDLLMMLKKIPVIHGFLFLDDNGRPYSKCKLHRIFTSAREKAGITNLTLYQWGRHSFGSQAINRGVPQHLIGEFLGHSDSRTTKRYAHTNLEGLKLVIKKGKKTKADKEKIVKFEKRKNEQ